MKKSLKSNLPEKVKDGPLSEEDWVEAATSILVKENVRGINIDRLCTKLGVTKGSFYWHFAKRSDLLNAVLQAWRSRTTLHVIDSVSALASDGGSKLRRLMELPRRKKSKDYAAMEMSIRDWARRVDQPRKVVAEVDQIRVNFFEQAFREQGFTEKAARQRAYIAYCMMMGDSILHPLLSSHITTEDYLDAVITLLQTPSK